MRIGLALRAVAAAAGVFALVQIAAAQDAAEVIKKRQDLMKQQGAHMKAIAAFFETGEGTQADLVANAKGLVATATQITGLFPQGTGMDDGVGRTGAKAVIWSDWAGFEAAAKRLEREASKLVETASGTETAAIAAQFEIVGNEGCGGCHTTFRQKLE